MIFCFVHGLLFIAWNYETASITRKGESTFLSMCALQFNLELARLPGLSLGIWVLPLFDACHFRRDLRYMYVLTPLPYVQAIWFDQPHPYIEIATAILH